MHLFGFYRNVCLTTQLPWIAVAPIILSTLNHCTRMNEIPLFCSLWPCSSYSSCFPLSLPTRLPVHKRQIQNAHQCVFYQQSSALACCSIDNWSKISVFHSIFLFFFSGGKNVRGLRRSGDDNRRDCCYALYVMMMMMMMLMMMMSVCLSILYVS